MDSSDLNDLQVMSNSSPYNICTWDDERNCANCSLHNKLGCRFSPKEFRFFIWNQLPSLVIATFGLVLIGLLTGDWWPLILFAVVCIALWGLGIETRLLCSHCPYWAEDSKTLHCWALPGSPKLWRYRPEPMNKFEKTILLLFFTFISLFPVLVEAYGIWTMSVRYEEFGLYALLGLIGVTLATIMAGLQFFYVLTNHFCSKCVNFSCPGNSVPKSMVDRYLEKNPVMREAWERSGYRLG